MRVEKKKNKPLRLFILFLTVSFVVYYGFMAYSAMIRTVRSVAQSRMEEIADEAIHRAIADSCKDTDYGELVIVSRNDEGNIESVTLNSTAANELKSAIALKVLEHLNKSENYTISVPAGNFFGVEFLSGIGPGVKFRIVPCNIAHIDFESRFKPAGINQVLHSLVVRVDIDIGALLPGFEEISNLSSSAIISETVIMGDVPETYLNIQK